MKNRIKIFFGVLGKGGSAEIDGERKHLHSVSLAQK
jgi:hypothetical protein